MLISSAAEVAGRDGVDAIRIAELARAAGVSGGAPFRHFPTRMSLLVAVAEEGVRRMVDRLEQAAAGIDDPLAAQRARGIAYVRFAVEEPGYFRVASQAEVLEASEALRAIVVANDAQADAVLGRSRRGTASPALARRTAGTLSAQALTYGLARMIVDGLLGPVTPEEAERLAAEAIDILGVGLRS